VLVRLGDGDGGFLLAFDGAGFLCPGDGKFELLIYSLCTYVPIAPTYTWNPQQITSREKVVYYLVVYFISRACGGQYYFIYIILHSLNKLQFQAI
jgi:hypothetical protein